MPPNDSFQFGTFELDAAAYWLRRRGHAVHLERRPLDLLILLIEKRGELVSRQQIADRIWGPDYFIEAEAGINTAIRKVRQALQDSPEAPAFVETVPGKGYRFIAKVQVPRLITVAVLPVVFLDPSPDRQYLADGLTEEVIAAMGQVDPARLRVIGRTSMMAYKNTTKSLSEIGEALGAQFLVESSIRADDLLLRITSRLIRAGDQLQLWCQSFDANWGTSVLAFQRQLSVAIASQVSSHVSSEKLNAMSGRHPRSGEAYDLYLQGRFLWHRLSGETTRAAIEHYKRAVVLDSDYSLAWSGLAVAFAASPITGDVPAMQVWPVARDAASHALRCAPDLAESHTAQGCVTFWLDWDLRAAEASFQRALQLDPSDALAHRTLAIVLAYQSRHDEARRSAERACQLDPLNAGHFALSAQVALFGRDYDSSMQFAKHATELDREFWIAHLQLAQAAERLGQPRIALQALERADGYSGGNSKVAALQGYTLAQNGREAEAESILAMLEERSATRFVPPYAKALVQLGLNRLDQAMRSLERAFEVHDVHLNFLLVDPKWDPLSGNPQFQNLIERCGFRRAFRA